MGETTGIAWTQRTWNPWHGCRKISAGCANCYMFREKRRYGQEPTRVLRSKTKFRDPLKWKDPALVFTCSWSDFFIKEADGEWRDEAWSIIRSTPHLTYQILTKRIGRVADHLPADWPLKNVWLGVSVEDQSNADRIRRLLNIDAAVHFVSYEPALGPINLERIRVAAPKREPWQPVPVLGDVSQFDALRGQAIQGRVGFDMRRLQWVIAGGESGPNARPCDVAWIRSVIEECRDAGVSCFVKQLGANVRDRNDAGFEGEEPDNWPVEISQENRVEHLDPRNWQGDPVRIRLRDSKGSDPSEWPQDLRVREFPEVAHAV